MHSMNTALSKNFMLIFCFLSCPVRTTQADERVSLDVKMTNLVDRMTRMKAEIISEEEIRDQRIAVIEAVFTKDVFTERMDNRDIHLCELEEESLTGPVDS